MTPGARVQAAIEVMQAVVAGAPAERELTAWGRRARYAGSKDRAAVRDHVYDALRRVRSAAWLGGLGDVRALGSVPDVPRLMAGMIRSHGADPTGLFTGEGHAPPPLELPEDPGPMPDTVAADLPDWIFERLRVDHGAQASALAEALRHRAPVILRTNIGKTTRAELLSHLADAGLMAEAHPQSPTAIQLAGAPRGLQNLEAFTSGAFDLQDVGSQALVDRLPGTTGRVLDLCAGGGGKALALAAKGAATVFAHDAAPARLRDLPGRAARAGVRIDILEHPEAHAPFDGVIADVPCSGSGSWRRAPEARWRLSESDLADLHQTQDAILERAFTLVQPGGWVAYMTCSLLRAENEDRVDAYVARTHADRVFDWSCTPLDDSDGFYLAVLRRGR